MKSLLKNLMYFCLERGALFRFDPTDVRKINLCCGAQEIPGYLGIDFGGQADLRFNLEKGNLPFKDGVLEVVTCASAINYFTRSRGQEIVNEVYRVLRPAGIARFSVQDLE